MYKYGVLVTNFLLISVTVGDPDVFPSDKDCAFVNCKSNHTNHHTCCFNEDQKPTADDTSITTTTAAIFFVAVIGSLVAVICMMFFCMNCEKMCNRLYHKGHASGERSSVNTVSAAVQTNSEASPPPYAFQELYCPCNLMEDGAVFEIHIPRCPSYVKDPPNYQDAIQTNEETMTVQNETVENDTAIEFSVDSSVVA